MFHLKLTETMNYDGFIVSCSPCSFFPYILEIGFKIVYCFLSPPHLQLHVKL